LQLSVTTVVMSPPGQFWSVCQITASLVDHPVKFTVKQACITIGGVSLCGHIEFAGFAPAQE